MAGVAIETRIACIVVVDTGDIEHVRMSKEPTRGLAGLLRDWASRVKRQTFALYLASRDPRVPALAKILIAVAVAYAVSPLDLIPDFIPVLGYLDDVLLLPLLIAFAVRSIPEPVWRDCCERAEQAADRRIPGYRGGMWVTATAWLAMLVAAVWGLGSAFV